MKLVAQVSVQFHFAFPPGSELDDYRREESYSLITCRERHCMFRVRTADYLEKACIGRFTVGYNFQELGLVL